MSPYGTDERWIERERVISYELDKIRSRVD